MIQELERCPWGQTDICRDYHDLEWGVPTHSDAKIFEMVILEGMQAGLSWSCILKKREDMRAAFDGFDVQKAAAWGPEKIEELMAAPGVIHNRLKLESISKNAQAFLAVQQEFGSFDVYIWGFVGGQPLVNEWERPDQVPAQTPLAQQLSKDMKRRGFKFCGPTIVYSLMQSIGMIDDHLITCPCHTYNRK